MLSMLYRLKVKYSGLLVIPLCPCPQRRSCNLRGPSLGCEGALHTYAWDQPNTSCLFRRVQEVKGLLSPAYFAADEELLFYDIKGKHALVMPCCVHKVYTNNVKDIVLMKKSERSEPPLLLLEPEDVS